MAYADLNNLAEYLAVDVSTLTANDTRLLARASRLIYSETGSRYSLTSQPSTDTAVCDALSEATCAQVEYWRINGEGLDTSPAVTQYSIGKVSETFSGGQRQRLAPRATDALYSEGLLSAGRDIL